VISSISYDPFGPIKQWVWGNGNSSTRSYDQDGYLTTNSSAGNATYTYYPDGSIATQTLDSSANLNLTTGLETFTNASTSNKLNNISGAVTKTYAYDNDGHTLSDGSRTFTYNAAGRLTTASNAGLTTTYTYNALGQRVKKTNTNGTTYFVYDEAGHELGEYDQAGNLIQELVWLGDIPVATIRTDQSGGSVGVFYIHTDHLNAPAKITRPSDNAIIWRWDHDPYGNGTPNQDPDGNGLSLAFNLRFPGQYYDAETGLYYNYFRDGYDPTTGRYTQSDPLLQPNRFFTNEWAFYVPVLLRMPAWLNPYAYVTSKPLKETDPLGLGPFGYLKCWWALHKLEKYNQECRDNCPDNLLGQIKFMQEYQSVAISDALLKCTCTKAAQNGDGNLCATWASTCVNWMKPSIK